MKSNQGFTVIELAVTMIIGIALTAMALPLVENAFRHGKADAGLNLVLTQLRVARQLAVDKRRLHRFSVSLGKQEVKVEMLDSGAQWQTLFSNALPEGITFRVEERSPSLANQTPDNLGATQPVSFNGSLTVNFEADGTAVDRFGDPANGILYLAFAGHPDTARAVTLFGATGRIRGWRLEEVGEQWKWK